MTLRRNRDFVLLQSGQLLSSVGSQSTTIAYPLLVLGLTGSGATAGLVAFARLLPGLLFGLVAGLAADRVGRRGLVLAADGVRAVALGGLGAAVLLDAAAVWAILLVAFVEGTATAFFTTAQTGALRAVVPARQLPDAVGAQEARRAAVRVGGPAVGGALYGLSRALPFVVDAVSYLLSSASLLLMRTPFQEPREPVDATTVRERLAEGFRFVWNQPFQRAAAFLYAVGNFLVPGVLLVVVVAGTDQGLSGGGVGILVSIFGASTLLGSLVSPFLRRRLGVRAILLLELWAWLGTWAFVAWPNVYVLTAALVPLGAAFPVTDSVVVGVRVATTPDHLLGRVESVRSTVALALAPLGPLVAGILVEASSARATVALFAAVGLALAVWGTLSPTIRAAPSLSELDDPAPNAA